MCPDISNALTAEIAGIIEALGGSMVDEFDDIWKLRATSTDPPEYTMVTRWLGAYQSIFCIASGPSDDSNYLTALAFGIPCVHAQWIKDCAEDPCMSDWRNYLLSAGVSLHLGGVHISQWINPSLFSRRAHEDWTSCYLAFRLEQGLLRGCNIAYVWGKQTLLYGKEVRSFVSHDHVYLIATKPYGYILSAMGAKRILKVAQSSDIPEASRSAIDYVLVENHSRDLPDWPCNVVDIQWLKEALLLRRLPPIKFYAPAAPARLLTSHRSFGQDQ